MQAGQLRSKITVQHLVQTVDPLANPVEEWQDLLVTWAAVEPVRSAEHVAGSSAPVYTITTTRFRLRYVDGIEPTMRVLHNGRVYEIVGILDDGRRRELTLVTRVVT